MSKRLFNLENFDEKDSTPPLTPRSVYLFIFYACSFYSLGGSMSSVWNHASLSNLCVKLWFLYSENKVLHSSFVYNFSFSERKAAQAVATLSQVCFNLFIFSQGRYILSPAWKSGGSSVMGTRLLACCASGISAPEHVPSAFLCTRNTTGLCIIHFHYSLLVLFRLTYILKLFIF